MKCILDAWSLFPRQKIHSKSNNTLEHYFQHKRYIANIKHAWSLFRTFNLIWIVFNTLDIFIFNLRFTVSWTTCNCLLIQSREYGVSVFLVLHLLGFFFQHKMLPAKYAPSFMGPMVPFMWDQISLAPHVEMLKLDPFWCLDRLLYLF